MQLAIEQANKSIPTSTAYCVGAVLVLPSTSTSSLQENILSTGYSREIKGNTHAEECALLKLKSIDMAKDATMYTTMEPCSKRLSGKIPCVEKIIESKLHRVVIGMKEPDHFLICKGISLLEAAGIEVTSLQDLHYECSYPNRHLLNLHR